MKQIHPYAAMFPAATPEEIEALRASINRHGIRNPIVLLGEEILDGRTRYQVATELKIPPVFRHYDPVKDGPDPLAWVVDQNLNRRHLTVGQRAALAVEIEKAIVASRERAKVAEEKTIPFPGTATPNPESGMPDPAADKEATRPRTEAAKQAGVSTGSVAKAKQLAANDPERFKNVQEGKTTLNAAVEASRKDADGQGDLLSGQTSSYRNQAADSIAVNHGDKFAAAVRSQTVLKEAELRAFMKLAISDQKQIVSLVATGWKVAAAVKFAKGIFEQDDRIREAINLAAMREGRAVISLAGYTLLVLKDSHIKAGTEIHTMVYDIAAKQRQPETATHGKVDNSLATAMKKAEEKKAAAAAKPKSSKPTPEPLAKRNPGLAKTVGKIAKKNTQGPK